MANPQYSVVIPAYNEEERIGDSLKSLLTHIACRNWRAEVLVVDDGSSDQTAEIVSQLAKHHASLKLLRNPGNRGKGYSVRHGLQQASGDFILFTDADFSTPISEADKLFAALEKGADLSIGSRWIQSSLQTRRQPVYRQLVGRLFNLVLWVILRLNYKDTQCGFKAFRRSAASILASRQLVERWGFDAELLFLARKLGMTVREVPVAWAHDHRSKIRVFRDGFRMVTELLIVRWYQITGQYELKQAIKELVNARKDTSTAVSHTASHAAKI